MNRHFPIPATCLACILPWTCAFLEAQTSWVEANFNKKEYRIAMRDGVSLFTAVYSPKNESQAYPMLMKRTPYSVRPYGEDEFPSSLGPSTPFTKENYIYVYQDVRGCYMSEGKFVNMTPHVPVKREPTEIDESSDTFDSITWLLANVANHNGRVGLYGISYPGFYAAASMIDAHPALKAVSPQAPIADWWYDDFHHHGAFFLPHAFNFMSSFGRPRPEPTTSRGPRFDHGTPDGYEFFLDLGALPNAESRYLKDNIPFWKEFAKHPNYDEFWQARSILPHLDNVAPAVMTVGGWFDAEDLYGPLSIYRSIETKNPGIFNMLVVGPWRHGGWARSPGAKLGNVHFDSATAEHYRQNIELRFFDSFLKKDGKVDLPEAYVFETGANRWRQFDSWPPEESIQQTLHVAGHGTLSFAPPKTAGFDEFISDPAKPVPFTEAVAIGMTREYMTDDQRFASRRPDVLSYETRVLTSDITLVGPVIADLNVSTSASDADWIVKLIDVFPPDAQDHEDTPGTMHMGGYQMMVRSEVIRGRFRNDPAKPAPFVSGQVTKVELPLQDILHTFKKGHRIMVQIQSTWFPLIDRNPQKYVDNIYKAKESDFIVARHRVYWNPTDPTALRIRVLPNGR